jgi:hypoxanthine phosphoribosyltransferase
MHRFTRSQIREDPTIYNFVKNIVSLPQELPLICVQYKYNFFKNLNIFNNFTHDNIKDNLYHSNYDYFEFEDPGYETFNPEIHDINLVNLLLTRAKEAKFYHCSPFASNICVLDGGFMFYSKLVEKLAYLDPKCDFIKVKSYENQTRGDLQLILTNSHPVEDSHVYVVDDIYDSGITLNSLRDMLLKSNPKSVNLVTLIKRSINEMDFPKNSIYGFEIKSEWVIGFGMDDESGNKRSLPNILAV